MPKGIPLSDEELAHRRREICDAIVPLILEKGFAETSMREIAEAAGVGKSTLYDYFSSKDEILIFYVIEEVRYHTAAVQQIIAMELSVSEKLRAIMRVHLDHLLARKQMYLKITFETQRLGMESIQRIQRHRYAYQDMLYRLVQQGIENHEFRQVNPMLVVRGMFTLITSTIYTSRPTGSPEEMLNQAIDIIFKGIEA